MGHFRFRKSIKITYGKPYKVTGDLEKENQILRDKVYKLMKKGDLKEREQRRLDFPAQVYLMLM